MEKNVKIAGVSLIEVMISMVLIALLLVAIVSIFPKMSAHNKGIQESDIAKVIATETVEYLQMFSEIPGQECGGTSTNEPTFETPRPIGATVYNIEYTIDCSGTGINPVEVTVWWRKSGKRHEIKVTGAVR